MAIHLLTALRRIKTEGPANTRHGICGNVHLLDASDSLQEQLQALVATWPDKASSGLDLYPIEGSHSSFVAAGSYKWQNPRRIALLDWVIAKLEQEE